MGSRKTPSSLFNILTASHLLKKRGKNNASSPPSTPEWGEVYVGAFQRTGDELIAISTELVCAPQAVALPDDEGGWHGAGTGFAAANGALQQHLASQLSSVDATALPHAADVVRLAVQAYARGEATAPSAWNPLYLRNNVALTLEEQRALRASR